MFAQQTTILLRVVQVYFNLALGILRQDEDRKPKIWKHLEIDPERQILSHKEFRGRMTGTTPTFTQGFYSLLP